MFKPHTLKIHKPFGRTILLSLAFLPLLTGTFEGAARAYLPDPFFPPPSVGSESPEFDIKVDRLDQLVAREGKVPCILLGSSMVNGGIDPVQLADEYQRTSGESITCFNFGLSSLVGEVAGPVAKMLVNRYHPSILILGVSARDFSDKFGEYARPLLKTPWLRYVNGEFNRLGWLVDHSASFRYYLGMQNWRNPENRPVIAKYMQEIDTYGFQPLPNKHNELVQLNEVLLTEYSLNPPDVDGYAQALQQNSPETQFILLEMPVHPEFFPYYVEGGEAAYLEKYFDPIASMAQDAGVPIWTTQLELAPQLPANGWNDRRHLNADGAVAFSQWLGQALAEAVARGDLNIEPAGDNRMFFPFMQNKSGND